MSDLPSVGKRIQIEETDFRSPVSESTVQKMGSTMNFILDHYIIPPGTILPFGGKEDQIASGFMACDGREISRVTYAALFTAIGDQWGEGNGVNTFNVPDGRGRFLRMVDATNLGQAGNDPDHATRTPIGNGTAEEVGSYQTDTFRSHNHRVPRAGGGAGQATPVTFDADASVTNWTPSEFQGGNETRPKNIYVYYMIKL